MLTWIMRITESYNDLKIQECVYAQIWMISMAEAPPEWGDKGSGSAVQHSSFIY